jgi:prepilin-type N-terminal cleavage/methylation domain-containing protein
MGGKGSRDRGIAGSRGAAVVALCSVGPPWPTWQSERSPTAGAARHPGRASLPWLERGTARGRAREPGRYIPSRAFTLIELLVVIAVIGILIAAIGLIGTKVAYQHRVTLTQATMRNVKMAIDQFAELDPLRSIYDRKGAATFGPYPPYMLAGGGGSAPPNTVAQALEPPISYGAFDYVLNDRLHRDLNNREGNYADWAGLRTDHNDDIRALHAYLRLYASDVLSQVPQTAMRRLPLDANDPTRPPGPPEYVNPTGMGTATNSPGPGAIDVLGIYDAWNVPLDYFLYVKLENTMDGWQVTQRIPVLRSWGITAEEYKAERAGTDALDPDQWIFSDPFPSPAAAGVIKATGALSGTGAAASGWARAMGNGDESLGYVP